MNDDITFSDKRCTRCGALRLTSGVCSLIPGADGKGGCPDPTYDYYAEKYTDRFPAAAQGTPEPPKVEESAWKVVQYFRDLHSVTYDQMQADIAAILRPYFPPASQTPQPLVTQQELDEMRINDQPPHLNWDKVHSLLEPWQEVWNGDKNRYAVQYPTWMVNAAAELFAHDICDVWSWNDYVAAATVIISRHFAATPASTARTDGWVSVEIKPKGNDEDFGVLAAAPGWTVWAEYVPETGVWRNAITKGEILPDVWMEIPMYRLPVAPGSAPQAPKCSEPRIVELNPPNAPDKYAVFIGKVFIWEFDFEKEAEELRDNLKRVGVPQAEPPK